jgi:beta-galactosidase
MHAQKKDVWRKDLEQIRGLGFNTVRAWIDWATGEPAEGRYNFETLDVITEEVGLKVLVQVSWTWRPRGSAASIPTRCLCLRMASQSARIIARSPAFLGFDLWSEPHVINWANPTYIANPEFCFCSNTPVPVLAETRRHAGASVGGRPRTHESSNGRTTAQR